MVVPEIEVYERGETVITGVLRDGAGVAKGSGVVSAMTLTLYNVANGAIINTWNQKSILNTNGGTLDIDGNFTLELYGADHPVLDDTRKVEDHLGLIEWTWSTSKTGKMLVRFLVSALPTVTGT